MPLCSHFESSSLSYTSPNIMISSVSDDRTTIKVRAYLGKGGIEAETLIDCGAGGAFISQAWVKAQGITPHRRQFPLPLKDVAGRIIGIATEEVTTRMKIGVHEEILTLDVANVTSPVILGMTWLDKHNPHIDWSEKRVNFTSKYCAHQCLATPPDVFAKKKREESLTDDQIEAFTVLAVVEESSRKSHYEPRKFSYREQTRQKHQERRPEMIKSMPQQYQKFVDTVFNEEKTFDFPIPPSEWEFQINLEEGVTLPPPAKIYPMTDREKEALWDWIQEMEEKGHVSPSTSSVASPCFFVKKKDGSLRLVVDWREVDKRVKSDVGILPRIEDIMDGARGAGKYSKWDCKNGYNCIPIKKEHRWLTAFRTPFGLKEFNVMHFGWKNAPPHFQRYMHHILRPILHITA